MLKSAPGNFVRSQPTSEADPLAPEVLYDPQILGELVRR